jgi:alpha-mannosidase
MPEFDAERSVMAQQIRARLQEIRATVWRDRRPIGEIECCVTGTGRGPERMPRSGWKPFPLHARWGGLDNTTWFRMRVRIPADFKGRRVAALLRPGLHTRLDGFDWLTEAVDALVYVNGVPWQGLDRNHEEVFLSDKARGGERFDLVLECCPSTRMNTFHEFSHADLAVFSEAAWDFYWDAMVPLEAWEEMDKNTQTAQRLLDRIMEALRKVDLQHKDRPDYDASLRRASDFLKQALRAFPAEPGAGKLILTGHSHIDTAWLWPLRETRRKVGRSFATVLRLMERYPEYHFSASQPLQYQYIKEHYPETWEGIRRRVKEGRWEICGAPWIEQDSNIAGGEAIIRQFLLGNRFFEREFGRRSPIAWLPDAFGYPWSLPQILVKCGITAFVTTKIDWSQFTNFPYSMFRWEGADGSAVFALMPPLNYNGNPCPKDAREQWRRFKQKDRAEELIYPFGWGDGGGGPTAEQIERGRRMRNLAGVPRCEFGRNQDSLDRLRKACPLDTLPTYGDELYLELHRGCQTTQARTKRNNRKTEVLLHEAELAAAWASLHGLAYNAALLDKAWKILLTNQFHDILPGSSITEVYQQADRDYAEARQIAQAVRDTALDYLAGDVDTRGPGQPLLVFNSLSWPRTDVVQLDVPLPKGPFHVLDPSGAEVPSQRAHDGSLLFEARAVPPLGYAVYRLIAGNPPGAAPGGLRVTPRRIENDFVRVDLDRSGHFTRLYDKITDREVIPPGHLGNVLELFDDRPHAHDAWDIDHNYAEERTWMPGPAEKAEVLESGPLRAVVRLTRRTERSVFTEDIVVHAHSPRVEVRLHVDWHEQRALLKVAFPVEVHARRATFHIQFAAIERNAHGNDLRDRARFEVPAHHWADLSEPGFGASLLNDCKYGYEVRGNCLRLSLLRATETPDPVADQGEHDMTYAVLPHAGDWREETLAQGYQLNYPLWACALAAHPGRRPAASSLAAVDADHVIIETVKKHEDSGALVFRVYEAHGRRGAAALTLNQRPLRAFACDMMEENDQPLPVEGHSIPLEFRPFEIKTIKVEFRGEQGKRSRRKSH